MPPHRSTSQRPLIILGVLLPLLLALAAGTMLCVALGWRVWFCTPNVVTRVLFCETANCSSQERLLVAGVVKNRIAQPAFGNAKSLEAVVRQPGAFSCIGDPANSNWAKSRHPASLTPAEQAIWRECLALARGPIPTALGPSRRPLVYYHDKSIGKPRSWDNQAWHAMVERTTPHFVFYSIVPSER